MFLSWCTWKQQTGTAVYSRIPALFKLGLPNSSPCSRRDCDQPELPKPPSHHCYQHREDEDGLTVTSGNPDIRVTRRIPSTYRNVPFVWSFASRLYCCPGTSGPMLPYACAHPPPPTSAGGWQPCPAFPCMSPHQKFKKPPLTRG